MEDCTKLSRKQILGLVILTKIGALGPRARRQNEMNEYES